MSGLGLNGSLLMGTHSLNAARLAVEIAGHNLANVNTPNYSRQRVAIASDISIQTGIGQQGTGVTVTAIQSMHDALLDRRIMKQQPFQGFYSTQAELGNLVQSTLGESLASSDISSVSSQNGLQTDLNRFFDSFQELSTNPGSDVQRATVLEAANALTHDLNTTYTDLQSLQSDMATQAGVTVTSINALAVDIASLNQQISSAEITNPGSANDLRDRRQAQIEALGKLINVDAVEQSNGTVDITLTDVPAVALVVGTAAGATATTESLSTVFNTAVNPPLKIAGSTTGNLATGIPSAGELGAHLDVINNVIGTPRAVATVGLLGRLDLMASQLVSAVNTQHLAGYDKAGTAGVAFFTAANTSAGNISVNAPVAASGDLIAASDGTGALSGANAILLADLRDNSNFGAAYRQIVSDLGISVSSAEKKEVSQQLLADQLGQQRAAISGVSVDEEMTNLTVAQHAYEASARFVATVDEMLKQLMQLGR